jgi:hypothetical protein
MLRVKRTNFLLQASLLANRLPVRATLPSLLRNHPYPHVLFRFSDVGSALSEQGS